MRISISTLSIVSTLGFILSAGAASYASMRYLGFSHTTKVIEVLASSEDAMTPRIESLLSKHENKMLIIGELKARRKQNVLLSATVAKMTAESKQHAIFDTFLWIGVGIFFLIFLIRAENIRKCKK